MQYERFFYLRLKNKQYGHKGHPIGVVVMHYADGDLAIAASLCSKNDIWNKELGIKKAFWKLKSKNHIDMSPGFETGLEDLLSQMGIPARRRGVDLDRAEATFRRELDFLRGNE